ncbi:MAG: 23S rRNA (adenine(2503)-C(2))-methyltransferase RlmN [Ardenticatenaceae bacterium]|nr:23S rRNA (adenine(2503)-C(2))-methyltransferase RlmN [Ardenticatenaceae bacterium]MCB8947452.1 23S rRNA (adenine(2503)-C(2))-methyltransferase RlmN [Ardenticatenaceae bacterium]
MQPISLTDTQPINLHDLTLPELTAVCQTWGYSAYHAEQIWLGLYQNDATELSQLSHLRGDLQQKLAEEATLTTLRQQVAIDSSDGLTRKFLLALPDGQTIETVLMQFKGRWTACVSTQVGCAMGCVFCATGQMGFTRHLTPGEIVGQILFVNRKLAETGEALRNIVFMGMGEPLHNYDHTMAAIDILLHPKGLSIAPKHITVSTVGVVPGILKLAEEKRPFRLAVSLHGATDEDRQKLVPPARRWPLAVLIDACRTYTQALNRHIFFEWTLIEDENDTPEQAHALGQLLQDVPSHINLIPLNPTVGYNGRPTQRPQVKQFQAILADYGIPSTVRQRRGIDIAAGCGQLKAAQ